jgi:MinD-like ATPase involved in chromosome partitioning or flagellar assembly
VRDLLTAWRDRTWPHRLLAGPWRAEPARVVAVAGASERAGTTTVAALLATAYAEPRRGRVVVVDARSGVGPLGERFGPGAGGAVPASDPDVWPALAPCLERTAEGLWTVIGDHDPARPAGPSDPADPDGPTGRELMALQAALATLSPHFAVIVLDCGDQAGPVGRFLLGLAHSRLLVAPASVDGVLAAAAAADRLELSARPDAAARTLVGLIGTRGPVAAGGARAEALLRGRGVEVRWFPPDRALAAGGCPALAELSAELRAATLAAAADLLRRAAPGRGAAPM